MYAAINQDSSEVGVGRSRCYDPAAIKIRRRQRSRDAMVAVDGVATRSASNRGANDDDDDVDNSGPNNDKRHQAIDVITPARRVTSDVTGTSLRHGTPIVMHHDGVIGRTQTTAGAPDLSGV